MIHAPLWSSFTIDTDRSQHYWSNLPLLEQLLRLGGEHSLKFSFRIGALSQDSWPSTFLSMLVTQGHRWQEVDLQIAPKLLKLLPDSEPYPLDTFSFTLQSPN